MKFLIPAFIFCIFFTELNAQSDTLPIIDLDEFNIKGIRENDIIHSLPNISKTLIIGGRKSETISVYDLPANLAEKTGRQIFAKIPGGMVYDMDGSGNQINFSVRGLDAHRSWEFNVRQNGVMINTDVYGYPASHYSMPMEAVERIELVRGTAALQYGHQFGGMLNYELKIPDTTKVFSFENVTSVGSFGLFASYNAIGGKVGKLTYYAYYHNRASKGYRENSQSQSDAQHLGLTYSFSNNLRLHGQLSRSYYIYRIPGPQTDEMFAENPRQSTRTRNFYTPEIFIPSLTLEWEIKPKTRLEWIVSGAFGERSSVTFDGFANQADLIDPVTNEFTPRNVDIDNYHSRTSEARLLHEYNLGKIKNYISTSLRYFNNKFDRRQRGQGTTGFDFDLSVPGRFLRDITLHSESMAISVENQFNFSEKLSISPGVRYEYGQSEMTGRIDYVDEDKVPRIIPYNFFTLGAHAAYFVNKQSKLYAGVSQAVRPVIFQDLIPGNPLNTVNEDLTNAYGYNAETGWENAYEDKLKYNLSFFRTFIGNRIGNILLDQNGQTLIAKDNIGDSRTDGIELYLDWKIASSTNFSLSMYTATTFMDARYLSGTVSDGEVNTDVTGNKVEAVPAWINRNGLTILVGPLKLLLQHQFVDETYADALNTATPPANAAIGIIPSYHVWDMNMALPFLDRFIFRMGVNNIFDKQYFTKRPQMYPGPGIWPSDGRGFLISLGTKI